MRACGSIIPGTALPAVTSKGHDFKMAGRGTCRRARKGAIARRPYRFVDGWMDRAAHGRGTAQGWRHAVRRWSGPHCASPDFTADLIEPSLTDAEKRSLEDKGYFEEHSEYSPEPNIFTRALMEDGQQNRVLTGIITTGCPVHILQGMRDPDVPLSACAEAPRTSSCRRRRLDADPGWRPPAVPAAGYRQDAGCRQSPCNIGICATILTIFNESCAPPMASD